MTGHAPWHILLIEDNPEDCADMRQMLLCGGRRRYRFSVANLGREGVRTVLELPDGPIDCVLLDYALPDMDGPEVLAALCNGGELPPCPVVVITGAAIEEGHALLKAGAQDFIGKHWTSADSLTRAVENAVDRYALHAERRLTENALRKSEERYRALFNSIDAGYAVLQLIHDAQGVVVDARCLKVNPAFGQLTGLRDVEGQTLRGLVPDLEGAWLEDYGTVARTGIPVRFERYAGALQCWFDVYVFRLGKPESPQVAIVFTDTTERRRVDAALVRAKAEADAANRAKTDFLLRMSHDLRSPLSAILGFTQLIQGGTPVPTTGQQASVDQILHAGWYLLGLIDEVLELSSIESGRVMLTMQAIPISEILDACQGMIAPQAQAGGITVVFAPATEPGMVDADLVRTKQVLINLLTNAIKYNRPGGQVTVTCSAAPGRPLRVNVTDTGPGLTAEQIAQLFQPFNRLGRECGAEPGTGIGLMICKRLVELMGGRIGVDSTVGVGSCFWFELAAAKTAAQSATPARTVLCIEDNEILLRHVEEHMARCPDVRLLHAGALSGGIDMARSARPDVILLGVVRQEDSGRDAVTLLSREPATANIPVIALGMDTGVPEPGVRPAAGFFRYLALPVPGDVFAHALYLAFQRPDAGGWNVAALENT